MENTIANQNAVRLAHLSTTFCLMNGLPATQELAHVLAGAVMAAITKWYAENELTDFNPQTELICDDAIIAAFEKMQQIVVLASISAQTGIGMDGFTD